MTEPHAELIKSLEKEVHLKRLNFEDLAQINPDELPVEEVPRYKIEYEKAVAEWRRACLFLSSSRKPMLDVKTAVSLLAAKDLCSSAHASITA